MIILEFKVNIKKNWLNFNVELLRITYTSFVWSIIVYYIEILDAVYAIHVNRLKITPFRFVKFTLNIFYNSHSEIAFIWPLCKKKFDQKNYTNNAISFYQKLELKY